MPERQIDPARLEGDELRRWYLRSPDEIERERQRNQAERYQDFFADRSAEAPEPIRQAPQQAADQDVLWVANGSGGWRVVRPGPQQYFPDDGAEPAASGQPPPNSAAPESGELLEIGNPHNPRLRQEWEREHGRPWPKTADGRNFDVAHIKAIADGGSNTLDNIQPTHPDEHRAQHRENGDNARFGRRSSIARAFGGRVEPPAPAPRPTPVPRTPLRPRLAPRARVNGLGIVGMAPSLVELLTGGIRWDTPQHTWYDLAGYPAPDDFENNDREIQRMLNCPPGKVCA